MKRSIIIAVFCALNLFMQVQASEKVEISHLLAIEISDWNHDGSMDKAVLALAEKEDDDGATLYIYLSDDDGGSTLVKQNIAWAGAMWGTVPNLSINKSGLLEIHSMNEAIGRDRWHLTLTVSYREKEFIVSGFRYSSYDTLDHDNQHECHVNLLNGKGEKDDKPFKIKLKKYRLVDWNDDQVPKKCFTEEL